MFVNVADLSTLQPDMIKKIHTNISWKLNNLWSVVTVGTFAAVKSAP
jgi:hypothetical protein